MSHHKVAPRVLSVGNPFRIAGDIWTALHSDLIFLWFASLRSLPVVMAAKVARKKIAIVVGGYESANCPEIDYGQARHTLSRFLTRLLLYAADLILPVSKATQQEIGQNLKISSDRTVVLYHGFEDIARESSFQKKNIVINIGHINDVTWLKKGIRDFVQVAALLPELEFIHVGRIEFDLAKEYVSKLPVNLRFVGEVPFENLKEYFASAKVYLQLSRHESFGCSVAEAMLFRCIPVVSDAAALPEVVGDCGIIVRSREPDVVRGAILRALSMPESEGQRARDRILETFSYEERERSLLSLIESTSKPPQF